MSILVPGTAVALVLLIGGAVIEDGPIVRPLAGGAIYFALLRVLAFIARGGFGFGDVTGSGYPGESAGVLRNWQRWRPVERDTLSYGYGISVTAVQLAQAFAALADEGRLRRPSLVMGAANPPVSVLDPRLARQVAGMLETVTGPEGTGKAARVANYRIAGKTGTSRKSSNGGASWSSVGSYGTSGNNILVLPDENYADNGISWLEPTTDCNLRCEGCRYGRDFIPVGPYFSFL